MRLEINFTARLASKQGWFFENTYNPPVLPAQDALHLLVAVMLLDESLRVPTKGCQIHHFFCC